MEIFISIDGVLRNVIQKLTYHYSEEYLNVEFDEKTEFEYEIIEPIKNDALLEHFKFQSKEECEHFLFIEYPIEIFGHAGVSYPTAISDVNKLIYTNKEHNFTVIGLNQLGKSKPATLFFLSKNGFMGNNIRFISSEDIGKEWDKCDLWITDSKEVINLTPTHKKSIKFITNYNQHISHPNQIKNLNEINEPWLQSLENATTSTPMPSQNNVAQNPT